MATRGGGAAGRRRRVYSPRCVSLRAADHSGGTHRAALLRRGAGADARADGVLSVEHLRKSQKCTCDRTPRKPDTDDNVTEGRRDGGTVADDIVTD